MNTDKAVSDGILIAVRWFRGLGGAFPYHSEDGAPQWSGIIEYIKSYIYIVAIFFILAAFMIILLIFWLPIVFCCPCKNWKPCLPANRFYIQSFFSPIALWCLLNILILGSIALGYNSSSLLNSATDKGSLQIEKVSDPVNAVVANVNASSQRVLDWVSFFEKSVSTIESSSLDTMMSNLQIDIASAKVVSDNILAKIASISSPSVEVQELKSQTESHSTNGDTSSAVLQNFRDPYGMLDFTSYNAQILSAKSSADQFIANVSYYPLEVISPALNKFSSSFGVIFDYLKQAKSALFELLFIFFYMLK
eukprot:TRINITY_DN2266_c0_g1_i2.p1 TRINITY_DN2266_c0_g1~~TRINITY_DN2266_c0_g1_i2.p1  ORF type:complete len:358 (+),score=74.81 TRINITY_DN2266_c0_g1_i2:154-1074(+)